MATADLSVRSIPQDAQLSPAPEVSAGAAAATGDSGMTRRQVAAAVVLFWVVFFLLATPASIIEDLKSGVHFSWTQELVGTLYVTLAWCAASPWILWLARRFPVEGRRRWWHLALHIPAGWLTAAAISATIHLTLPLLIGEYEGHGHWSTAEVVVVNSCYMLFIYLAFVAVAHAVRYFRQSEERERLLAQAQVQALKAQLNPHFLYNTLNAVSEYAYKDAATAERLIAMLSDLLRLSFSGGDAQKLPLADELAFVRRYLDIQRLLLGDRLDVHYAIDPATLDAQVPNFILQPLVENAIVHGISRRAAAGRIELGSRVDKGALKLWVSDNGPGLSTPAIRRHGIGLANTRSRLQQLYGTAQRLQMESPAGGGFCARIELPCERADKS
jgi:signal transduction histidine kinase